MATSTGSESITLSTLVQRLIQFWQQGVRPALTLSVFGITIITLVLRVPVVGILAAAASILLGVQLLWQPVNEFVQELAPRQWPVVLGTLTFLAGGFSLLLWSLQGRTQTINWEVVSALGESIGALGQILVAVLAAFIAWRQYVNTRELTQQQNRITQQQTIDAYFQGIADLALDDQGFLEDWPQERMFAEGRTAAILSSIDAEGKGKVIRFLSTSRLLTPLKRDQRLGRPILDGTGLYEEDRVHGERVIDLDAMLAGADLAGIDLRLVDFSNANLTQTNFSRCNLMGANFTGAILDRAQFVGGDLRGTRFFYGRPDQASPRQPPDWGQPANFQTGAGTGAIIEGCNFTGVRHLDEEQRYYCCAWGGSKTRSTIPGGCEGIPNKLGR
ncbi:MAG: pentapeptide repeat-containing protein [Gloeomargaritaceae cyanobacterium C42_A2020_066]|nr:pentapeptide repeat-containing protein [Gloeomargaritaceae cyanobacterium C42_A2020_066]